MLQFEAKPEYAGEGALSSITSVKSKFYLRRRAAKYMLSVIIKRLPKDPFSRFFVTEGQFDLREIKFYTQVRVARAIPCFRSETSLRADFNLPPLFVYFRYCQI